MLTGAATISADRRIFIQLSLVSVAISSASLSSIEFFFSSESENQCAQRKNKLYFKNCEMRARSAENKCMLEIRKSARAAQKNGDV